MTTGEFSNQFDVLVHSYTRFRDFDNREPQDTIEFNEYEKSFYLTKAQEEIVLSLYTGKNSYGEGFEQTEEIRRYLATLVKEDVLNPITNSSDKPIGMGSDSYFFTLPEGLWFITFESVKTEATEGICGGSINMEVVPVRQDEYHRLKNNPFRGANSRRALRLDLSDNNVEIVCKKTVDKYYLRYVRKVNPIVLENLPDDLTVNGMGTESDCELPESLHQRILETAVVMALRSRGVTAQLQPTENRNYENR